MDVVRDKLDAEFSPVNPHTFVTHLDISSSGTNGGTLYSMAALTGLHPVDGHLMTTPACAQGGTHHARDRLQRRQLVSAFTACRRLQDLVPLPAREGS
jgi:hypothetical protein